MIPALVVVKVGGSLYDLPDLGPRLDRWLRAQAGPALLLIPGGGPTADLIRELDRRHELGEKKAHWLALRSLTLNAWLLEALLPPGRGRVVRTWEECQEEWQRARVPILNAHAFAKADEGRPGCLPHSWAVTSDSLAARVAAVWGASRLLLLKSRTVSGPLSWEAASAAGLVDVFFPQAAALLASVEVIDFRAATV